MKSYLEHSVEISVKNDKDGILPRAERYERANAEIKACKLILHRRESWLKDVDNQRHPMYDYIRLSTEKTRRDLRLAQQQRNQILTGSMMTM